MLKSASVSVVLVGIFLAGVVVTVAALKLIGPIAAFFGLDAASMQAGAGLLQALFALLLFVVTMDYVFLTAQMGSAAEMTAEATKDSVAASTQMVEKTADLLRPVLVPVSPKLFQRNRVVLAVRNYGSPEPAAGQAYVTIRNAGAGPALNIAVAVDASAVALPSVYPGLPLERGGMDPLEAHEQGQPHQWASGDPVVVPEFAELVVEYDDVFGRSFVTQATWSGLDWHDMRVARLERSPTARNYASPLRV